MYIIRYPEGEGKQLNLKRIHLLNSKETQIAVFYLNLLLEESQDIIVQYKICFKLNYNTQTFNTLHLFSLLLAVI